jgi:Flp pilus assembly protein TadD
LKAIARLELERGRGDAAIAAQQAAIRRQPRRGDSYLALAAIFEQLGRRPEAAAAVQTARGLVVRM